MKYSYVRFPDDTEVTYSDIDKNGNVLVRIETPIEGGFKSLGCELPSYKITEADGYSQEDIDRLIGFLRNNAHLIIDYATVGGFENAAVV